MGYFKSLWLSVCLEGGEDGGDGQLEHEALA